jgi:hypothetical protein
LSLFLLSSCRISVHVALFCLRQSGHLVVTSQVGQFSKATLQNKTRRPEGVGQGGGGRFENWPKTFLFRISTTVSKKRRKFIWCLPKRYLRCKKCLSGLGGVARHPPRLHKIVGSSPAKVR